MIRIHPVGSCVMDYFEIETPDLCELAGIARGLDIAAGYTLAFNPLQGISGPSRYRGLKWDPEAFGHGRLGGWGLRAALAEYGTRFEARGVAPPGSWGIVVPLGPSPVRFPTFDLEVGDAYLLAPNDEIDVLCPAGLRLVEVHFDPKPLLETMPLLRTDQPSSQRMALSPCHRRQLLSAVYQAIDSAGSNAGSAAPDPAGMRAHLFDTVAEILVGKGSLEPAVRIEGNRRQRAARLARDYMDAHLDRPLTADELVSVTGVSRRSLEMAFRERYGQPLIAYHRQLRLNHVRRVLKQKSVGETTVSGSATRFGFSHLGRFSVDYKRHFGESPSETLRVRTAPPTLRVARFFSGGIASGRSAIAARR